MLSTGLLPPIDSTVPFDLEPMRQALRRAAAHQNRGRIVISMKPAAYQSFARHLETLK